VNNQRCFYSALLTITVLALLCSSCGGPQSDAKAERVAMRFFRGEFSEDDTAPDGTFETTGEYGLFEGYEWIWVRPDEAEIKEVIVRDSMRPNSKEVTIMFSLPSDPDSDSEWGWDIDEGTAFIVVESLDGRWVVWCAELEAGSTPTFPDVCEY
jgi:hypothetical protein